MTSTILPVCERVAGDDLRLSLPGGGTAHALTAGAGEPLLLIHGVGLQAAAWGPQIAALSASHRVIAVDMPGHGLSDPLPAGALLPDFVGWAAEVIRALGLGAVNVAGHSMGALITGGLAIEHPGLIRRAALLNGVYRRDAAARDAVIARADGIARGQIDIEGPLLRWFCDDESATRSATRTWLNDVDPEAYATAYRAFATGDATYADRIGEIDCPLLVLTGDGDANSSPAMARKMAEMAPNAMLKIVEGHRHMVNLTAPDIVTETMRAWLALT